MNHSMSLTLPQTTLPTPANWSQAVSLPPLGHLDAYISAVHRMPMLSLEEEQAAARRWRDAQDIEAAGRLVMSHLRLVVSLSRQYLGYGLPQADLIQEGNVGLMKAVKRFDPDQGVRLVSYAIHWIKAEIHEYILKNWRMVRVATTKAQKKLFFNLRSMRQGLRSQTEHDEDHRSDALSDLEVERMARELDVKPVDVREMEVRLSGGDVVLDPQPGPDGEDAHGPIAWLADASQEPSQRLERSHRDRLATQGLETALAHLDARSRRIVEERWLKVNDDGSGGMTLHQLAAEYGISAERVRQIETAAMKKMRQVLSAVR